ncbi:MAG: PqqD family protein [Clostridia bacterium]|nr:PqqD family protein [Clostridia bacterium]
MKLNKNFVLRDIAGNKVILPWGSATVDLNGMLRVNSSGVLLWNALENGADIEDLVEALMSEYDVDRETAISDVTAFIEKLKKFGCIEE